MDSFLLIFQIVVALLLIIIVMVQKPASEGLGFGGGQNSVISAKTATDILTKATVFLAVLFMTNSLLLAVVMDKKYHGTGISSAIERDQNNESKNNKDTHNEKPVGVKN